MIGPWNYPLVNSVGDAIPALAAGNAVVVKPSEVTPLTSLLFERGLHESGLPDGVFQVAVGTGETGAALIDEVDMVMFTGSTRTGRKVMERAAQTLTPVSLELGGKDPMIVLADADLERAANAAVYYSMQNGGQTCISIERVYVEAPVYDEFVAKVTEKTAKLRQGPPNGAGSVDVGAMTFPPQLEIVAKHVQQARDAGARVTTGGHARAGAGRFYEPTVLADVDHSMTAMTEETFGPTLPVMKVADAEEAIRQANDSPYGLGAAVFTKDLAKGERIARRIDAGAVCVNDAALNYLALELPMGGWKESGMGVRHGPAGLRKYTHQQALMVTRFAPKREIHYFPYNAKVTGGDHARHQAVLGTVTHAAMRRRRPAGLRELLAQAPAGAVLQGVDGVDGAAEPLRDLGRREPGDQPQDHHLALIGRAAPPAPRAGRRGARAACSSARGGGRHLGQRDGTLRSQVVERSVAGDAQQPGHEGGAAHPVMGEGPWQAREHLAGDVLRIVLVVDDRQHVAEDVVRVEQVQQAQRIIVSVAGADGGGGDQRHRVRRMIELTAATVSRPCRRRLETVRRTADRHLSHSLRDEQPCPCPKSPTILAGVRARLPLSVRELKSDMRPVDACPTQIEVRCGARARRSRALRP